MSLVLPSEEALQKLKSLGLKDVTDLKKYIIIKRQKDTLQIKV